MFSALTMPALTMPVLSLLILTPLAGAVLTAFSGRHAKPVALLSSLVPLALAVFALTGFNPQQPGFQFVERLPWLPTLRVEYFLGIDGISLPFIALTALLIPLCILASWRVHARAPLFMASFLALEAAVIGVFCALDFILFYIFWEAMLIPMFLLIGIWGGENRVYAALKFFLYTFLGSVLMLIAAFVLYKQFGHFDLTQMQGGVFSGLTQKLLWLALFAAFAVKVPMWPFHTWLPDAHVQAPTAGSVILAGVLLKMGAYGFLRLSLPIFPEASAYFAPFVFTISAIAVVYAALVAFVQTDIKKLIAYSSVSHMGLVTLGIFAGTATSLDGALLIMVNHGIVSAGLFLAVGVIYDRLHTRELANFGGLVNPMPQYAFVVMLLMLAAVALPGTNGFVGEFLGLAGSWPVAPVATMFATTGVIFGALYMLWLYRKMIFGLPSSFVVSHMKDLPDLTRREWIIFLPLLVFIPLLGLQPNLATHLWQQPVQALTQRYVAVPPQLEVEAAPKPAPVATPSVPATPPEGADVAVTTLATTAGVTTTLVTSATAPAALTLTPTVPHTHE